ILLVTGVVAGFASGLLGLGGAFIMTPLQYLVYTNMGVSPDVAIKTAFGTSLLVVLTTALSGAWRHHREKAVNWRVAFVMGGCGFVFGLIGATLTEYIPTEALKIAFGVIGILSCIRMFFAANEHTNGEPEKRWWVWMLWAIPIGLMSGLLGVGGGVLMIPILVIILKFKMHHAVANSLAIMIFASIGGIIGYIINGVNAADTMQYSVGYINLTSWALLAVPAAIMAQVGAMTAHRIPRRLLIYIFTVILLYVGLKMIGVFEWLGWPI
ncbi:MAG: sulfite exporter TauE/SafE family protein, partial [Dehalococcoidales bacterium]|nr:sulfite exporter TauE/SafE family protein [Dehalococcoidales bacterium]